MSFGRLPKDPLLHIFSFLSIQEQGKLANTCKQFNTALNDPLSSFYKAKKICEQIESDPNYQPNITVEDIKALVVDKDGNPIHKALKSALAIKPLDLKQVHYRILSAGKFYQIISTNTQAVESHPGYRLKNALYLTRINPYKIIFVSKETGQASIHEVSNLTVGDLSKPSNRTLGDYLNKECLHPPKDLLTPSLCSP